MKQTKKVVASSTGLGIAAELPPVLNVMLGILPVGNRPKNKYYISFGQENKENKRTWM